MKQVLLLFQSAQNSMLFLKLGSKSPSEGSDVTGDCVAGSLFDVASAENRGSPTIYVFDEFKHADIFTESYALSRFGAFWLDYLFTMKQLDTDDGRLKNYELELFVDVMRII